MITMDVFKGDAFSATSLSAAIDKFSYLPNFLGSVGGLFDYTPIRTPEFYVEERAFTAAVLPVSTRGAPPNATGGENRVARPFSTVRFADASRVNAGELQSIRAFGSETELKQLEDELGRRQTKMAMNMDLTLEHLRLGAVQGITKDKAGNTLYNWATEFGVSVPSASFALTTATNGALRASITAAKRSVVRGLKGAQPTMIMGLCDDAFWDKLIKNAEFRAAFVATPFAQQLLDDVAWKNGAIDWVDFGGIRFVNYRGTDDNSTVAVPADTCAIFPVGAGIFQEVYAPGERFGQLNLPGQRFYSMLNPDFIREMYVDVEIYSYPMTVCLRPGALFTATSS